MSERRVLWRLLRLVSPFAARMALATLLAFATIVSGVALMATSAYIIAGAALHPSIAQLQLAIVGVRFFGILRGLLRYAERYVSHQVTFDLLAHLRVWFYRSLEPLAPACLIQARSGDLLSRILADVQTLENFYLRALAPPLAAALVVVFMVAFMGSYHPQLAVVTLLALVLSGLGIPLLTLRLSQGVGRGAVRLRAELNSTLVDGIQGMADILAFGAEERHQARVHRLSQAWIALQARLARVSGLQAALTALAMTLTVVAILGVAVPLVNAGRLDGLYLAVLVLAVMASFEAVLPLPLAAANLESSSAAARRLFDIVDAQPVVHDPDRPSPEPSDYDLVVEHLSFRYAMDEPPALVDVSFELPQGQHLAIVGPSGSGKTTLVNLLLRFWEYQEGYIGLGGHDLRSYRAEDVRRMIAVVTQHTYLFGGTLRDNLRVAHPDATEADLLRALEQAQLREFSQALPEGLDTWIGEQGVRLSAGERQRLAIARALLRNAPLLILDEATANLDALTEQQVFTSLEQLMLGRTTLLITHRLVGLERMDRILVLRAGRAVEQGRHDQLLQADTLYRRMWEVQRQAFDR